MSANSSSTLMTKGPIWKKIIAFAIPLFLGNLFQQFYNTADSLIVGNFLGSSALAAVSSSGSLIFLMVGFFNGLAAGAGFQQFYNTADSLIVGNFLGSSALAAVSSSGSLIFLMVGFFNGLAAGAGVVVARYFGAKKYGMVQKAIHTIVTLGFIFGILLTFIGVVAAPQILVLIGTPAEVLPNSLVYFRIYFCGSLAFVMYNFMVGILQAVGDSRHPLIYLIISSLTNIILDLVLVAGCGFGVGAAAAATIISQFLSALLCLRHLLKAPEEYRVSFSKLKIDFSLLRQILSNGLPSGLQNSIIAFQWSSIRTSELYHCTGKCSRTVQHQ